jgi:hypothetical protein
VYETMQGRVVTRSRVLVAVINNRRDFQIARDQGWYRIPVDNAPSRVGADFLAFYQTKAFGDERWSVNYYAPVRRYLLAYRRALLPDEEDHPRSHDLYYRIEIGPLTRLPRPIPSLRLRRITFIPTTLKRLFQAQEINDLWCGSWEEEQLWRAFKENGLQCERRYPLREDDPEYCVDFAFFCENGKVALCLESEPEVENVRMVCERAAVADYDLAAQGWVPVRLRRQAVRSSAQSCLAETLEATERHGGLMVRTAAPPYPE